MFSVFFTPDGTAAVRDFAAASTQDTAVVQGLLPRMLDQGVYLPPSAYEAWFLSAAHDDEALPARDRALPAAAQAAAAQGRHSGEEADPMNTVVHLLRHGEVHNPQGILYGRAAASTSPSAAARWPSGSPSGSATATSPTWSPRRSSARSRPPPRSRPPAGSRSQLDERVIESSNVFEGKPFRHRRLLLRQPQIWSKLWNPFRPSWGEPYKDIAARMWAAVARRPRRGRGPRGGGGLPPAADLDHPAARRGPPLPARPAQAGTARCAA